MVVFRHLSGFTFLSSQILVVVCGALRRFWWFVVISSGLQWFAMVCGGLSFSHTGGTPSDFEERVTLMI